MISKMKKEYTENIRGKKKVIRKMKKKTKLKSVMKLHSGLEKLGYSVKKEKWKCKVRLR